MEDYIVIKALENGVNIIGLTRGRDTKFHHTEKLDKGEVYIAQFTEVTSAIKINGAGNSADGNRRYYNVSVNVFHRRNACACGFQTHI